MSSRLLRGFPVRGAVTGEVVATIGVFDGVHLGHQRLLEQVWREAEGTRSTALVTFDPHPRCILDPAGCPPLLSTVPERALLAAQHGVRRTIVLDFTRELSTWTAERFCDRLLESLDLRRLVIGRGFALGQGRTGDESFLRSYGAAHGFGVTVVPPVLLHGARVSSGRVRSALLDGHVDSTAVLLGRRYRLPGTVVRGDGRGRSLGFPTANMAWAPERCVPGAGVYATWLRARGEWRPAATSIGMRPTFGGESTTVEAFVLDFDGDLYGAEVKLEFVARLREERAYPDSESLVAQMRDDVARARSVLQDQARPELAIP